MLFYMASKRPESGVWPSDLEGQADVLRWLFWESAHWDAESCGMVAYEKGSKDVLGLGPPEPAFIARGEQNFSRFAAVLNDSSLRRSGRWRRAVKGRYAKLSIVTLSGPS
jgi:glutathione S-transferase